MVQVHQALAQQGLAAHQGPHLVKAGIAFQATAGPEVDQRLQQTQPLWWGKGRG